MTAEFASEWLSWRPSDISESPSQRTDKTAKSPSLVSENIGNHNHSNPFGSFVSSLTRRFQDFEDLEIWQEGHARLSAMERPHGYPAGPWQQLIANSEIFLREWAGEAVRLGWDAISLYGTDSRAPYHRLDRAGLVLLIGDNRIAGLEEDTATLRTATGATQTYRRADYVGSMLVWELAGSLSDEERMDRDERAAIKEFDG